MPRDRLTFHQGVPQLHDPVFLQANYVGREDSGIYHRIELRVSKHGQLHHPDRDACCQLWMVLPVPMHLPSNHHQLGA